jgi:tetratricopeptide (TPR) repeat protein
MKPTITKYAFVVPASLLICCLVVRFVESSGPFVDHWISQADIERLLDCIGNKEWKPAALYLSRTLTAEGYLLAALFLSTLLGMKHYLSATKKHARAHNSGGDAVQPEGIRLGNMGLACCESGQIEKAIDFYEQAMAVAYQTNDHEIAGNTLGNLANAYQALGNVEKALDYHAKALVIFRKIGDRLGEGSVLGNLGKTYISCGQMDKAIKYNKQSLLIFEEINSPLAIPMRRWLSELENRSKRAGVGLPE